MFVCEVAVIGLLHHRDNQLIKSCDWSNGTILGRVTTSLPPFLPNINTQCGQRLRSEKEGRIYKLLKVYLDKKVLKILLKMFNFLV